MPLAASLLVLAFVGTVSESLAATDAEKRGLEIAIEADKRDTGFADLQASLQMTLANAQGESATRALRVRTLEQTRDGDKSLIIFDTPPDVRGTAFLSFTHKVGTDDQWLYLPALKRVKRIAQSNKSGPFMGSEFAYEDLASQEVEKYNYRYLKDETLDARDHFVVELDPVDRKSGYSKQVVWVDQQHYRVWKVDFYDRKGVLLKTLTVDGYRKYLEQYWRPDRQSMINHQTGKHTELVWSEYEFRNGYSDRDFNKASLKRVR